MLIEKGFLYSWYANAAFLSVKGEGVIPQDGGDTLMTAQQKERITLLRAQGESYARIAGALGLSENTVQSFCRRNHIVINTRPSLSVNEDVCAHCGHPLIHTPGSKHRRFCCDGCRMAWWKTHPKAVNRKAVYYFVCPVCGAEFEAYGNAHRKYCSRHCWGKARRASQ